MAWPMLHYNPMQRAKLLRALSTPAPPNCTMLFTRAPPSAFPLSTISCMPSHVWLVTRHKHIAINHVATGRVQTMTLFEPCLRLFWSCACVFLAYLQLPGT